MTNTEKPTTKAEQKKTGIVNTTKQKPVEVVKKPEVKNEKKTETKPEEKKKKIITKPIVKKTEAVVNGKNVVISTKYAIAICRFIKGKKIEDAISDLEKVLVFKKPVPMKGEIPHRKGKIMSGRFPQNATKEFIKMLKTLKANANVNGLEEPIISEAIANFASRPYGRFGRVKRKRTHIFIKVKELKK